MSLTAEEITTSINRLQFWFAEFGFHITARQPLWLPAYKGSAFRGGFGNSFKKVCCVVPGQKYCNHCPLNTSCAYAYIFETPQTRTYNAPIQSTNLPHPFVISPPMTPKTTIEPGESLSFQVGLIGQAIEYLPYFVYAFDQLGEMGLGREQGKYSLDRVTATVTQNEIYNNQTTTLTGDYTIQQFADFCNISENSDSGTITLNFLTPTRILYQNRLIDKLPIEIFIRNLLRRASLLAQIHCNQTWDLNYQELLEWVPEQIHLVENSLTWRDWERFSRRQQQKQLLGGFVGKVTYHGQLSPLLPLFYLGQYIHLGKNTSFGMGKYLIEF